MPSPAFCFVSDSDFVVCEGDVVDVDLSHYGVAAVLRGRVKALTFDESFHVVWDEDDAAANNIQREWKWVCADYVVGVAQGLAPPVPYLNGKERHRQHNWCD